MQLKWVCRDVTENHEFSSLDDKCMKCGIDAASIMSAQGPRSSAALGYNHALGLEREKEYYRHMEQKIQEQKQKLAQKSSASYK